MTAQEGFWNWFLHNETELFAFEPDKEVDRDRIFDALHAELVKVHPDLTFEFGPPAETREFVISAGGIKKAFPAVVRLAEMAPKLPRWQVTAFRPRRWPIHAVQIGDTCINPDDVQFTLFDNGKIAGIYLFIPGYHEKARDLDQIAYLMLDEALGEYDVETRLGLIKRLAPEVKTEDQRYPLPELPAFFDALVARLEGQSGIPS